MLLPILHELDEEGLVKIVKVHAEENPAIAQQFNVRSLPTLVFSNYGDGVASSIGFSNKNEILELMDRAVRRIKE